MYLLLSEVLLELVQDERGLEKGQGEEVRRRLARAPHLLTKLDLSPSAQP